MEKPGSANKLIGCHRDSTFDSSVLKCSRAFVFRLNSKCLVGIAVWLGCSGLAFDVAAQSSPESVASQPEQKLTLADVKQRAFERNWDLLAAKSGIDLASAQFIVTKEFPNPTASINTFKIGTHENGTVEGNSLWHRSYDTIAAVSQLIEIAGKRGHRQAAARAGVLGARARFLDAKRTLDQGVTKTYLAALLAENNVRILNESAGYLQHEAKIAQDRFAAGDISDADKKQIEIGAEQFDLQAKAAEAAAVQARIAVEVLLGLDHPAGHWNPADSLDSLLTPPTATAPHTNAARPDVLAAQADLAASQANLKLQKAVRVPDPTFSLGVEHNPPSGGPAEDTFNIGVSFPLPLWNLNRGNIKAAQANVEQFEIALGKIKTQALADIANGESAYGEANQRFLRYRDLTGPKSAKVRESVAFAYEKGGASLVNLLDAEKTDNDVRLATVQAMADTASAAADLTAARMALSIQELDSRQ